MDAFRRLGWLLRQRDFRRLVGVRVPTQGADAVIQVGMASYVLFNPQNQPNAWAIATVIALAILPFSVVGPLISPILDRFARQRIVIVCDLVRLGLAVAMALLVGGARVSGAWQPWLYVLLLAALSLNRLQLAALGAGMPFTVAADQYLDAAAVCPMIGPISATIGGSVAGLIRLTTGELLGAPLADALVFSLAALGFLVGVGLARGFGREQLGPRERSVLRWRTALSGFSTAFGTLRRRPVAGSAIGMVCGARLAYGLLMCMVVLLYRQHFYDATQLPRAMVAMGAWFLASGVGYAASGLIALPLSGRFGVRATILAALGLSGLLHLFPAALLTPPALLAAALLLGLCAQSVKICADAVVQAHVADAARGRVMVIYDIGNNLGVVLGTVLGALLLPPDGFSRPIMLAMGCWFGCLAGLFWLLSRSRADAFDRGTARQPAADRGPA